MSREQVCLVYGLYSTRDGLVRYVGQTDEVETRLSRHISSRSSAKTPVALWIVAEMRVGWRIKARVLADAAEWDVTERDVIARLRSEGAALLNVQSGGGRSRTSQQEPPPLKASPARPFRRKGSEDLRHLSYDEVARPRAGNLLFCEYEHPYAE